MANMDYIEALTHAIKQGFSCEAKHIESVAVKEVFRGQTAWEGIVEVFELNGHPEAKRAYGWGFKDGKKATFTTILGVPPVENHISAVRMFIANQNK